MPGMSRVGLSPAEMKRSGTYSEADRKKMMKKGGKVGKKEQGYKAREDESIAMRKKRSVLKSNLLPAVMSLTVSLVVKLRSLVEVDVLTSRKAVLLKRCPGGVLLNVDMVRR